MFSDTDYLRFTEIINREIYCNELILFPSLEQLLSLDLRDKAEHFPQSSQPWKINADNNDQQQHRKRDSDGA